MRRERHEELEAGKREQREAIEALEQQVSALQLSPSAEITPGEQAHDIEKLKHEHLAEIERVKQDCRDQMEAAQREQANEVEALKGENAGLRQPIDIQSSGALLSANEHHEEIEQLKREHSEEMERAKQVQLAAVQAVVQQLMEQRIQTPQTTPLRPVPHGSAASPVHSPSPGYAMPPYHHLAQSPLPQQAVAASPSFPMSGLPPGYVHAHPATMGMGVPAPWLPQQHVWYSSAPLMGAANQMSMYAHDHSPQVHGGAALPAGGGGNDQNLAQATQENPGESMLAHTPPRRDDPADS